MAAVVAASERGQRASFKVERRKRSTAWAGTQRPTRKKSSLVKGYKETVVSILDIRKKTSNAER
jgi:hypothetical protein